MTKHLKETVKKWNSYVDEGADPDFARGKDAPMHKIDKPPFYAAAICPVWHDSYGGLRINGKGQVLDVSIYEPLFWVLGPQALLYDVHGNLPALDAVLADARTAGAERFILGGDYALFGAFPVEAVERLRSLDAIWVRGNTDRWLVDASDAPESPLVERALAHCRAALGEERVKELAETEVSVERDRTLVCHASPRSDMLSFSPTSSESDADLLRRDDPGRHLGDHVRIRFSHQGSSLTGVIAGPPARRRSS